MDFRLLMIFALVACASVSFTISESVKPSRSLSRADISFASFTQPLRAASGRFLKLLIPTHSAFLLLTILSLTCYKGREAGFCVPTIQATHLHVFMSC